MEKTYNYYIKLKENDRGDNVIQVSVFYSLGGFSYFTYRNDPRGYYVSAIPMKKSGGMVSYIMFDGVKDFIKEAKRFSEKGMKEAIEESKAVEQKLIDYVCAKYGVEVEEENQAIA